MKVIIYGTPSVDELSDNERKVFYQTLYKRLLELSDK